MMMTVSQLGQLKLVHSDGRWVRQIIKVSFQCVEVDVIIAQFVHNHHDQEYETLYTTSTDQGSCITQQ